MAYITASRWEFQYRLLYLTRGPPLYSAILTQVVTLAQAYVMLWILP
jgi:hypothetical protein